MKLYNIALLLITAFTTINIHAIPAKNIIINTTQSDGTELTLSLHGDEFTHFYMTQEGVPVFENTNGDFCYGYFEDNELTISSVTAHNPLEQKENEILYIQQKESILNFLKEQQSALSAKENKRRITRIPKSSNLGGYHQYIGDYKGLVLLVEFANLGFSSEYASIDFNRMFNSRGYSDNGSVGSVSDYFRAQSYGQFNLNFDIIGPIKMPNNYEYYGINDPKTGIDKRVAEMVTEAVKMADQFVDYNDYDWDKDGVVDQVYIIYAGYGESYGAPSNTIWPHESSIEYYDIELDGVKLATYGCSCELAGRTGTTINGIGTSCHEFSHCLGFPDLYDTDYSGAYGMGYWDIMDSGSYNGPNGIGEIPYGYSAYERWTAGWLTPTEIDSESFDISLRNIGDFPEAAIIYNDGNRNEFYLLENHQVDKWFYYVGTEFGQHGMMVTHINYDEKAWALNRVNQDPKNQRMSIIPADNEYTTKGIDHGGDLFPGKNNVTILGNNTHSDTGGFMYNPNTDGSYKMNKSIVDISEGLAGIISFGVVLDKELLPPVPDEPTDVNEDGFTANWQESAKADSYKLEYVSLDTSFSPLYIPTIKMVDNIETTSLRLDWLGSHDDISKYRVKSVYHGIESEWSEYRTVKYNAENGIYTPEIDSLSTDDEVTGIFSPDGIRRYNLLPGLNIVVTKGGVKKIYVPV